MNLGSIMIGNGAGSVKTLANVKTACRTPMTRITVGSITKEPRIGNIGETYYFDPNEQWSLNSKGLPNIGLEAYCEQSREMIAHARGAAKQICASISPFSPRECAEMTDRLLCLGFDGVEINGSCPNVWDDGKHHAIPALDPDAAAELFEETKRLIGNLNQVSFKLSPTRDVALLTKLAGVFRAYHVEQLVCCNTKGGQSKVLGNGRQALSFCASEEDREIKHVGGLAGSGVITDSVFVAGEMIRLLPNGLVYGSGGIFKGVDAARYLDLGCAGVFSTTGYMEYGPKVFVDILMELQPA